jgi:hypothetical protein
MTLQEHFNRSYHNIYICNKSLREILNISPFHPWNEHEMDVVTSSPIMFFRFSLHYTFVAEYVKLIAPLKERKKEENVSSLYRLNQECLESDKIFSEDYKKNTLELDAIKKDPFSKEIRDLRDKKLLHSDANIPQWESFRSLTLSEIDKGFELILRMCKILKNCTKFMGFDFHLDIPDDDYRTEVFIHHHSIINANPLLLFKDFYTRRTTKRYQ